VQRHKNIAIKQSANARNSPVEVKLDEQKYHTVHRTKTKLTSAALCEPIDHWLMCTCT